MRTIFLSIMLLLLISTPAPANAETAMSSERVPNQPQSQCTPSTEKPPVLDASIPVPLVKLVLETASSPAPEISKKQEKIDSPETISPQTSSSYGDAILSQKDPQEAANTLDQTITPDDILGITSTDNSIKSEISLPDETTTQEEKDATSGNESTDTQKKPTQKPAIRPYSPKVSAPMPYIYKKDALGRRVCSTKGDKPHKSKKHKGRHMDMECCLDPDEYPNPNCYYSPEKYGKYLP